MGIILAKKLGYSFIDTDVYIQTREKRKLPEIIRMEGMAGFLSIEEQHILSIKESSCVIATGGSVVYGNDAMAYLSESGLIVYLKTDKDVLLSRLVNLDKRGVVRQPGQNFEDLFRERQPLYSGSADIIIDCNILGSPVETADEIMTAIGADQ